MCMRIWHPRFGSCCVTKYAVGVFESNAVVKNQSVRTYPGQAPLSRVLGPSHAVTYVCMHSCLHIHVSLSVGHLRSYTVLSHPQLAKLAIDSAACSPCSTASATVSSDISVLNRSAGCLREPGRVRRGGEKRTATTPQFFSL